MNKKLAKQIETKLDKLTELLDNITAAQAIDPNDSDTWDSDTLYSLVEDLKESLQLLEDKKTNQRNEYGELIINPGLCSLVDDWESQREEEDYE
jgi:hypothetical protein